MTVNTLRRRHGIVLSLSLLWGGCDSAEQSMTSQARRPCSIPSPAATTDAPRDLVVVQGADAPCEVMFEVVQRLTGSLDGTLPRPPVSAGPGGRWLTATYVAGEFAVWSPSGELERLIGSGSGDGPGEFGRVRDLIVDSVAGTIHVFSSSSARVEVYSLSGEHVRGIRIPSYPSQAARLNNGTIVASISTGGIGSPGLLLIESDTVLATGPARRMPMPPEVRPGGEGAWTVDAPWYQLNHHIPPRQQADFTLRREVDWFPERPEEWSNAPGPLVRGFTVDLERLLVFVRVTQVTDPGAPSAPFPVGGTPAEAQEWMVQYFDGIVEAFTFDGDLVASTRFDDAREIPEPIGGGAPGNLWFRLAGVTESIEILRPRLVEKASRQ